MFKTKSISTFLLVVACLLVSLAIILVGSFLALDFIYASKFFPKTKIAGISVAGKTKDEAKDMLTSKIQEWNEKNLKVVQGEKAWEIPNKDLGIDFDIDKTITDTFKEGKKENIISQFTKRLGILIFGLDQPISINENSISKITQRISQEADINALNVGLKIEDGEVKKTDEKSGAKVKQIDLEYKVLEYASLISSEIVSVPQSVVYPNSNEDEINKVKEEAESILRSKLILKAKGKEWNVSQQLIQNWLDIRSQDEISVIKKEDRYELRNYLNNLMEQIWDIRFLNKNLEIKLQKNKTSEYLKDIATQVDVQPKNASLGISGDKVIVLAPEQNGEVLDVDIASERILDALSKKEKVVSLTLKELKAQVREDNLQELGIVELIGRGESDASGSSSSRRTNISVGSSKINGALVAPGEEFSLNKYLVPVDASNGFLPELVIKPGKLVKEYGGGLCQVATTTFRAALYAGLPITERKNHAFAVHYYDWPFPGPGVDATIYPPHPDLRFKNDTGKYILVQTSFSGNRLTYDLYGTKGARRSEIENPQYVSRNSDGSSTTIFYRNVYEGDKRTRRDSFTSYYKPSSEFPREGN